MKHMKTAASIILAALIATTSLTGCSGGGSSSSTGSAASGSSAAASTPEKKEAKKLTWWYYHKGLEAEPLEKVIADFNASQSDYIVEGFSVPDKQKYLVAMSSNDSPDMIELSNQDIVTYQSAGLLENLSTMGEKTGYDFGTISKSATAANTIDGTFYGVPYAVSIIQMFYNKDLLEKAGATEPPKTMEELYELAVKGTTLDAEGNIDTLGYPLFPLASARQEGIYAFGGTWVDSETGKTPTADSQGVLDSLNMNVKYRQLYGMDKVQKFVATGNTNRYTPQDIFFAGKQMFRFDGPWLAKQIHDNNPDLNYGVTMVPGTAANPELRGVSRFETASLAIPVGAKEKDGAWALIDYVTTKNTKDVLLGMGSLPANTSLYDNKELMESNECFPQFVEALKQDNGIQYPKMEESSKYTSLIDAALDLVYNGKQTPEQAMKDLQAQASQLK